MRTRILAALLPLMMAAMPLSAFDAGPPPTSPYVTIVENFSDIGNLDVPVDNGAVSVGNFDMRSGVVNSFVPGGGAVSVTTSSYFLNLGSPHDSLRIYSRCSWAASASANMNMMLCDSMRKRCRGMDHAMDVGWLDNTVS